MARNGHFIKTRQPASLKSVFAELIAKSGGTHRAAELVNSSATIIHKCTDPLYPPKELRISWVRILEKMCGEPIVTEFLAAEAGCLLIKLRYDLNDNLMQDIARIGREYGEFMDRLGRALSDGFVDPSEARELIVELDEMAGAMAAAREVLSKKVTDHGR